MAIVHGGEEVLTPKQRMERNASLVTNDQISLTLNVTGNQLTTSQLEIISQQLADMTIDKKRRATQRLLEGGN